MDTPQQQPSQTPQLTPSWVAWVEDNLRRNTDPRSLVETLQAQSLSKAQALSVIVDALDQRAQAQAVALTRAQKVLDLHGALRPTKLTPGTLDPNTLYEHHWETNTPLWAPGCAAEWTDLQAWDPRRLAERFGEERVRFQEAKSQARRDQRPESYRSEASLREYVDRVYAAPAGNQLYMIANDRNLQHSDLGLLLDELALPSQLFDASRLRAGAALWLGPQGTVTSLHHDQSNILFCQMNGRKRFIIASPDEPELLKHASGLYSQFDLSQGLPPNVRFYTVDLGPGDVLFIPVGWWHYAESLSVSVGIAVNAFTRSNVFSELLLGAGAS